MKRLNKIRVLIFLGSLLAVFTIIYFGYYGRSATINVNTEVPSDRNGFEEIRRSTSKNDPGLSSEKSGLPGSRNTSPSKSGDSIEEFEKKLVRGDALVVDQIYDTLYGKDFDRFLERMRSKSIGNSQSVENSREYSKNIEKSLGDYKTELKIRDLACGISFCGAIVDGQNDSEDTFRAWLDARDDADASPADTSAPFYVNVVASVPNGGSGGLEHRIFFSSNPRIRSVMIMPFPHDPPAPKK